MASVTTNESTRNEHNKSKSKLKMPKIFNAIVSKITPSKLAVDAVSVNRNRSLTPSMESWQSLPSDEIESTSLPGDRQIMTRTPEPVVPIFNHLSSHTGHSTNNNSVAVTNIGVQHNLTFSQINGLHVGNVNVVHASSTKNGISNGATENIATMTKIEKTRTIKELMECTESLWEEPGLGKMRVLSQHMGANWRFTLRELGFSEAEIDQKCSTHLNHTDGVFEIVYRSLLEWSRKQDDPTVGQLCTFLWNNGQKECVIELKKVVKRKRSRNLSESLATEVDGDK